VRDTRPIAVRPWRVDAHARGERVPDVGRDGSGCVTIGATFGRGERGRRDRDAIRKGRTRLSHGAVAGQQATGLDHFEPQAHPAPRARPGAVRLIAWPIDERLTGSGSHGSYACGLRRAMFALTADRVLSPPLLTLGSYRSGMRRAIKERQLTS